jgi:hypothetical protein
MFEVRGTAFQMQLIDFRIKFALALSLAGAFAPLAHSTSCTTQAQLTADQRDGLSNTSRVLVSTVQTNDMQTLRSKILPAVAGDFSSIAASAQALSPLIQHATVTVDALYVLDAPTSQGGAERTQFFCGSPTVVLTFEGLPQGTYAVSIVHATGVSKPQQVALILAKAADSSWQLAGFYSKPMTEDGHDGVWYWKSARQYAQAQKRWDAWLYYHLAANLLDPLDFLSSPNLERLQRETEQVHPNDAPGSAPITLNANGAAFTVTSIDTTTEFGALDLDLHYAPSEPQAEELRTPMAARQQVTNVMTALLAQHPELRDAFHGIWVHADHDNASLYALELPMSGITEGHQAAAPVVPQ